MMFTENDFMTCLEARVYWEEYALLGASGEMGDEKLSWTEVYTSVLD